MPLDIHVELAGIKARVPAPQRPAAYQQLVKRLERAKDQATHVHLKHRLSVCIHYVKSQARQDRDWA